jgi:diguanylate cyclase (GGDEF)-like protein
MKFIGPLFRRSSFSLNTIIIFTITALLLFATALFTVFNFSQSKGKLVAVNTEKMISIVVTYSEILNGDSIELDFKRREKNANHEQWKTICDSVLKKNDLKYMYVMNVHHSDSIEYYLSAKDHEGQIEFLDKDHVEEFEPDLIKKMRNGEETHGFSTSYTPKYGWLISSHAVVKNSNNQVIAFVGADKDMNDVINDINEMGIKLLIISFLLMVAVFSIMMFVVRKIFIYPIGKLVRAADNFNMLNTPFEGLKLTRIKEYDSLIKSFIRMERKIRTAIKKSFTDDLTKLNNRYFFTLSLESILKPAKQEKKIAFIIVDIDYFKQINDTYGHEKGDFVLRGVGIVLQHAFEDSQSVVARLGGDEFAICMEHVASSQVVEDKCGAIKEQLSQIKCSEKENGISASIGAVITSIGETPVLYSDIFSAADAALYEVKAEGRNGYKIASI